MQQNVLQGFDVVVTVAAQEFPRNRH